MNKRIQELMGQTLDEKFAGTWSVMDLQDLTKFADRFAELIVGDCIRKINDIAESSNNPQPIYRVAVDVLEHFGVTE